MDDRSGRPECCSLHRLKFADVAEFPDDKPDFNDILQGFAIGRCQATCRRKDTPPVRIPLCLEDVEETDDVTLFDDDGFLVSVCSKHASVVLSRAVEGRACTGAGCSGAPGAIGQAPTPRVGRVLIGSRLYCTVVGIRVFGSLSTMPRNPSQDL